VVVFVAPNKALVGQMVAEVLGRCPKALVGLYTSDLRENVTAGDVLITVPDCLVNRQTLPPCRPAASLLPQPSELVTPGLGTPYNVGRRS
jgi:hypothetical protein